MQPLDMILGGVLIADLIADRPTWAADGLCMEYPELNWFPEHGVSAEPAKAVCRRCLVRRECVAWALVRPDVHGIWGATSVRGRTVARTLGLDIEQLIANTDGPRVRACGTATGTEAT